MLNGILEGVRLLLFFLPVMAVGVVLAQLLLDFGWLARAAIVARPVQKLGSLPPGCGASFLTAFFSPSAANAMLVRLHQAGRLDQRQVMAAALINTFPGTIMHWRTGLPLVLPLLGLYGLAYYLVVTLVGAIKLGLVLIWSRWALPSTQVADTIGPEREPVFAEEHGPWETISHSCRVSARTIWRIAKTAIPVTLAVYAVLNSGWADALEDRAAALLGSWTLSPVLGAVVVARLVSGVGAFSLAGGLLSAGEVTGRDVVLALSLGNLLEALPGLRYMIPYYLGLFGRGLGFKILIASIGLKTVIYAAVLAVVFSLWR